jgi:hypothetical protein
VKRGLGRWRHRRTAFGEFVAHLLDQQVRFIALLLRQVGKVLKP